MTKIKICGVTRLQDIEYVNQLLPDYIGFILNFPKSHRNIHKQKAYELKSALDERVKAVGVFVDAEQDYIIDFVREKIIDIVQLHGNESEETILELREKLPNVQIWKAFKIDSEQSLKSAYKSNADQIILDNGYGTGEVFDWTLFNFSNQNKTAQKNIILAGGINADNLQAAIDKFRPFAVDISSGVETNKIKDFEKIKRVIEITKSNNKQVEKE